MADRIALKSNSFSSKSLKTALNELRAADKSLNGTLGQMGTGNVVYYSPADRYVKNLFSGSTISNADTAFVALHTIRTELERIAGLLDSGPEEIVEADKDFKGQKSNAWQRTIIAVGGGIGGLFKHGGTNTGRDTLITAKKAKDEVHIENYKSTYNLYREKVEHVNKSSGTGEIQHYQNTAGVTNTNGDGEGQCNWVSMTTIIQRIEGNEEAANCNDLLADNPNSMEYYMNSSIPMKSGDNSYIVKQELGPYGEERLCALLEEHPEGIMVYDNGHWIVITDYENDGDKIQFYANDGVNNGGNFEKKGRIELEYTWFYKDNGGRIDSLDEVRVVSRVNS